MEYGDSRLRCLMPEDPNNHLNKRNIMFNLVYAKKTQQQAHRVHGPIPPLRKQFYAAMHACAYRCKYPASRYGGPGMSWRKSIRDLRSTIKTLLGEQFHSGLIYPANSKSRLSTRPRKLFKWPPLHAAARKNGNSESVSE